MDENKFIPGSELEPQETTPPELTLTSLEKKQKPWLVIGLVILLIASLGTTGYFAYQNTQLKQQAREDKLTQAPTATPPLVPNTESEHNYLFLATGVLYSQGTGFCKDMIKDAPRASFVIDLPQDFKISGKAPEPTGDCNSPLVFNEIILEKNGTTYKVIVRPPTGFPVEEKNCPPYEDQELKDGSLLRLWKSYKQETGQCEIVSLNVQSISIDGYFLNSFIVTKEKPNDIFSPDEISLWKNLFNQIKVITSPEQL